ncbi:MAG: hypothetical protein ACR2GN_08470 [Bacteroidia bacterium]
MVNYEIKIKDHFRLLSHLILGTIMILAAAYYAFYTFGYDKALIVIFGGIYILNFLPTVYLHIEYYFVNKNNTVEIDDFNKIIIINGLEVPFNSIEKIIFIMPPVWHRRGFFRFFSFEDYHYASIIFKDETIYFFTSILTPSVEDAFRNISTIPKEKKIVVIASIYLKKLLSFAI